jgi:hypothetical protein
LELCSRSDGKAFPILRVRVPETTGLRSRSGGIAFPISGTPHFVPEPPVDKSGWDSGIVRYVPVPRRSVPDPTEGAPISAFSCRCKREMSAGSGTELPVPLDRRLRLSTRCPQHGPWNARCRGTGTKLVASSRCRSTACMRRRESRPQERRRSAAAGGVKGCQW